MFNACSLNENMNTRCCLCVLQILTTAMCTQSVIRSGFPGGSDGEEAVCREGDPGLIPGSGGSPGEGNGNPLQYSAWRIPWRGAWGATVHGVAKTWIRLSNAFTFTVTRRCRQNKTIVHISTVCSGIWPNLQHITLLPTHVYTLTF